MEFHPETPMKTAKSGTQGEGDYAATRRYRKRTEEFLAKNDVGKLARAAAPRSESEARELKSAEESGRARAKSRAKPKAGTARATR
jgi:hypothetical protein